MNEWWHGFLAWLTQYQSNVVWSGLVLLIYLAMSRKLLPKLETNIVKSKLKSNSAIKGLFAAGEMVGGIFYFNYPGGSGLTSGAVFGKIAGKYSAKL